MTRTHSTGKLKDPVPFTFALDDWGLSPGVNEGILRLLPGGRVRSVSVMVNQPFLLHGWNELLASGAEISLHLNFTEGGPLSPVGQVPTLCARPERFFGHKQFIMRFLAGQVNRAELLGEAERQISLLCDLAGAPIATLEGHHNIHLVPGMLRALAPALLKHGMRNVRAVESPSVVPAWLATRYLRSRGRKAPMEAHWNWRPVCPLVPGDFRSYRRLSRRLRARPGGVFVAHPAWADDLERIGCTDPLKNRRRQFDLILRSLSEAGEATAPRQPAGMQLFGKE